MRDYQTFKTLFLSRTQVNNYVEKYQYRPFSNYAFNSNGYFKKANGYSDYGNCKIIDGVTPARNDFFRPKGDCPWRADAAT